MDVLDSRTKSGFPLSIGTGLALETIVFPTLPVYDPERAVPYFDEKDTYNCFYVNVSTLARNVLSSIPSKDTSLVTAENLLRVLKEEIDSIKSIMEESKKAVVFYSNDYTEVFKKYGNSVVVRKPTTEKQIFLNDITEKAIKALVKANDLPVFTGSIRQVNSAHKGALIMTHQTWDLLSYKAFPKLTLLESHTGKLKTRKDWYTKYFAVPNFDMSIFPLQTKLLLILGDHILISPKPLDMRKTLCEIAIKGGWNSLTTEDKVTFDITRTDVSDIFKMYYLSIH